MFAAIYPKDIFTNLNLSGRDILFFLIMWRYKKYFSQYVWCINQMLEMERFCCFLKRFYQVKNRTESLFGNMKIVSKILMKIRKAHRLTKQPAASLSDFLPACLPAILPIGPQAAGWLETSRLLGFSACLLSSCPCLADVKPGQLLKLPPAHLAFLRSPKSSLSCPGVQDAQLSDLILMSHPPILLSKEKLPNPHVTQKYLCSLMSLCLVEQMPCQWANSPGIQLREGWLIGFETDWPISPAILLASFFPEE